MPVNIKIANYTCGCPRIMLIKTVTYYSQKIKLHKCAVINLKCAVIKCELCSDKM